MLCVWGGGCCVCVCVCVVCVLCVCMSVRSACVYFSNTDRAIFGMIESDVGQTQQQEQQQQQLTIDGCSPQREGWSGTN